ncbi:MAG: ankyrin repeat domain-containing protein, partial [Coxiellaceae bacterium]|nr:ankyrin repeat domain-containing protein [Coxiellaceae bacterium]
ESLLELHPELNRLTAFGDIDLTARISQAVTSGCILLAKCFYDAVPDNRKKQVIEDIFKSLDYKAVSIVAYEILLQIGSNEIFQGHSIRTILGRLISVGCEELWLYEILLKRADETDIESVLCSAAADMVRQDKIDLFLLLVTKAGDSYKQPDFLKRLADQISHNISVEFYQYLMLLFIEYKAYDALWVALADPRNKAEPHPHVDAKQNRGKTMLFHAVQTNDPDVINRFVERNVDLLKRDLDGKTAMDYCEDQNIRTRLYLLALRQAIICISHLHFLLGDNHHLNFLKEKGVDFDAVLDDKGATALMVASFSNKYGTAFWLLSEANVNPDLKNADGKTARDIALENNHLDIVELIDNHKNSLNYRFNRFTNNLSSFFSSSQDTDPSESSAQARTNTCGR